MCHNINVLYVTKIKKKKNLSHSRALCPGYVAGIRLKRTVVRKTIVRKIRELEGVISGLSIVNNNNA